MRISLPGFGLRMTEIQKGISIISTVKLKIKELNFQFFVFCFFVSTMVAANVS
jgi:hypothetical protein